MPKVHRLDRKTFEDPEYYFECPGCGYAHWFNTTGTGARWSFNGDMERPTITPSLHVNPSHPEAACHSFVTDGQIRFLDDCFHALKGQTVSLPDIDG